ncbi:hypothetical protein [Streptomyces sp. NPDC059009]|uniref:hypothetical protein n=1 Tax=Streptomyces sp. NPDC059009 TaxID=3346694 RepID=UPI00368270FE
MRRRDFVRGLTAAGAGLALPLSLPDGASAAEASGTAAGAWQQVPAPGGVPATRLLGVAATAPDRAWAVGIQNLDQGPDHYGTPIALTWNGSVWSVTDVSHLTYTGGLRAVAATTRGGAWALGTDTAGHDQLLAWDGATWREARFPGRGAPGTQLTDIAAGPGGRFWVAGSHGGRAGMMHGDGKTWRWCEPLPDEAAPVPYGIHVTHRGEVWVYGDIIARWDGAWTVVPHVNGIRSSLTGLLAVAPDDVWLTGLSYGIGGPAGKPPAATLEHWDGTQWSSVQKPFNVGILSSVMGDEQGRPDLISGWDFWDEKRAHYLRWNGTAWISERGPESPRAAFPLALARIPGTDGGYWSVGADSFYPIPPTQLRIERFT